MTSRKPAVRAPRGGYYVPIWVGWTGVAMLVVGVVGLGVDIFGEVDFFGTIGRYINLVLDVVLIGVGFIFVRSVWAR